MKIKSALAALALTAGLVAANSASATTYSLDFTTLAAGAVAQTTYAAQGLTIFQSNPTDAIDVQAQVGVIPGLSNSIYGANGDYSRGNYPYYPTDENINFNFARSTSNISFFFDNEGYNGLSTYTEYDKDGGVISSGLLTDYGLVSLSDSGVRSLVISNNGNDWVYGVSSLTYSAVPETSTWIMMLAGFAGLGFVGYRRNKAANLAA